MIVTKFGIFRHFYKNVSISNFSEYFERLSVSYMVANDQTVEHGEEKGKIFENCRSECEKTKKYTRSVLKYRLEIKSFVF
jgi:hypothetical protein